MTDRKLMQMALDALITAELEGNCEYGATETLRARLAQPEPEPVAWLNYFDNWSAPDNKTLDWHKDNNASRSIALYAAPQRQPELEPVAWGVPNTRPTEKAQIMMLLHSLDGCQYPEQLIPLYTAPPQRGWVGLTDEEMFSLWVKCPAETEDRFAYARAIEQALREKNS